MKQKFYIDTHKGATAFFVLLLIILYKQWDNPTAWIYLALHGTYGFLWVLKSRIFPDKQWEQKASPAYGLYIWAGLSLYWIAPWLLISRGVQAPPVYQAVCVSIYAFGVFFHFASDMQKYTALQLNPQHLINDGMFGFSRNMNYFGEFLIYGSFAMLSMHWLPFLVLLLWIILIWVPNMRKKDRSLSRYPEFDGYRKKTRLFIPFLF